MIMAKTDEDAWQKFDKVSLQFMPGHMAVVELVSDGYGTYNH